eukprot:g1515.t1
MSFIEVWPLGQSKPRFWNPPMSTIVYKKPAAEKLSPWIMHVSSSTKRSFFVHRETGEKTWTIEGAYTLATSNHKEWFLTIKPQDLKKPQRPLCWYNESKKEFVPTTWREIVDKKTNRPYYFNMKTKKTQWATPSLDPPNKSKGLLGGGEGKGDDSMADILASIGTVKVDNGNVSKGKEVTSADVVSIALCRAHVEYVKARKINATNSKYKDEPERIDFTESQKFGFSADRIGKVAVISYHGTMFHRLRDHFHIDETEFVKSLSSIKGGSTGEGKSGMLFFKSCDAQYIIKTVKDFELELFEHISESYYYHMLMNKDSLLCRFFGLYKIRASKIGTSIVIVMNNCLLSPLGRPLRVYDLKGSTHGRITPEKDFKNGATGKDLNLKEKISIGVSMREKILRQIEIDRYFLTVNNIMDYSVLLGVFDRGNRKSADLAKEPHYKSIFQRFYGGMQGTGSGKECVYFATIIDILQPYDWRKSAETMYKTSKPKGEDDYVHATVSAIPSRDYGLRFLNFFHKMIE